MRFRRLRSPLPLLGKELAETAARKRTYAVRVIYAICLFACFGTHCYSVLSQTGTHPLLLLGHGKRLFDFTVALQFTGIFLFLPALTSGMLTTEKENHSLPLLLLTDLRPREILLQKYIAHLIPMFTILLVSLPLTAIAYALGGISSTTIAAGAYCQFLACLQVAAIALFCSAFCATSASAFIATYALGALFYSSIILGYAILSACGLEGHVADLGYHIQRLCGLGTSHPRFGNETAFLFFPPFLFFDTQRAQLRTVLLRSLPIVGSIVAFLLAARFFLIRRAFVPTRNALIQIWHRLDGWFNWGVVLISDKTTLPGHEPVAWREVQKKALGKARYLIRLFLLLEIPIGLIGAAMLIDRGGRGGQADALSAVVGIVWVLAVLAICAQSANAIASERVRSTLDVLLTSPIRSRDIILQKMAGIRRLALVFIIPFLTLFLLEAWWEVGSGRYGYRGDRFGGAMYLLWSAATVCLYLPMFAWVAFWVGSKARSRFRAVLNALVTVVIATAAPIVALLVLDASHVRAPLLGLNSERLLLVSPAGMVAAVEWGDSSLCDPVAVVLCLLLHLGVLSRYRRKCLRHADRLLGRAAPTADGPGSGPESG